MLELPGFVELIAVLQTASRGRKEYLTPQTTVQVNMRVGELSSGSQQALKVVLVREQW